MAGDFFAKSGDFRFLGADQVQISPKMAIDEDGLVPAGKILSYEDGLRLPEAVLKASLPLWEGIQSFVDHRLVAEAYDDLRAAGRLKPCLRAARAVPESNTPSIKWVTR